MKSSPENMCHAAHRGRNALPALKPSAQTIQRKGCPYNREPPCVGYCIKKLTEKKTTGK